MTNIYTVYCTVFIHYKVIIQFFLEAYTINLLMSVEAVLSTVLLLSQLVMTTVAAANNRRDGKTTNLRPILH